jgi:hypothetical protein
MMLKRAGRCHDPFGVENTQPGELTIACPACPHPGKNLPPDWESAPYWKRYVELGFEFIMYTTKSSYIAFYMIHTGQWMRISDSR